MKRLLIYCAIAGFFSISSCLKTGSEVEGSKEKVTTLQAINIFTTTATLQGQYDSPDQKPLSKRGFVVSHNPLGADNPGVEYLADGTSTGLFTCRLEQLDTLGVYYVEAFVVLQEGNVIFGNQIAFSTLNYKFDTPPSPTSTVSDVVADEADIIIRTPVNYGDARMTAAEKNVATMKLSEIGVYYWRDGEEPVKYSAIDEADAKLLKVNTDCPIALPDLEPATTYNYYPYIVASCYFFEGTPNGKLKWTSYGAEVMGMPDAFTTKALEQPRVTTEDASPGTDVSTLRGVMGFNGYDRYPTYGFYYGTDAGNLTTRVEAENMDASGNFSLLVRKLTKQTTYYFAAFVKTKWGEVCGSTMTFTTLDVGIPMIEDKPMPYSYSVQNSTTGSYRVTCNIISDGGQTITWCGIHMGTSPAALNDIRQAVYDANNQSFVIDLTGLQQGVNYYYQVVVTNASGSAQGTVYPFRPAADGGKQYLFDANATGYSYERMSATGSDLLYFELDPFKCSDGNTYFVLDRNLGATQTYTLNDYNISLSQAVMPSDAAGYFYQWGLNVPSSTTNNINTAPAGWRNTPHGWLQDGVGSWPDDRNPCPADYRLLTSAEWKLIYNRINPSTMLDLFNSLLIGNTNNRLQAGGFNTTANGGNYYYSWCQDAGAAENGYVLKILYTAPTFDPGSSGVVQNRYSGVPIRCGRVIPTF